MANGAGSRVEVEGVGRVLASLKARTLRGRKALTATVGYSAPYALYVHEDLTAFHPNGRAKFLEEPARRLQAEMASIVRRRLVQHRSLEEGVVEAANLLLQESQAVVPIDTGRLHESAFVEVR
jgi:hypothetical protein